jgi:CRISPR-associated protein Cmr6
MIPMNREVANLIGDNAAHVDNLSLRYDKFALPKVWGHERKLDDAARWNVLRLVARGRELLRGDERRLREQSTRPKAKPENRERDAYLAGIVGQMAQFDEPDAKLLENGARNARQLLDQVRASFGGQGIAFEATLGARLMINLAGGVVENAGICLDRCFGLPYIPGSAVKGITRAHALSCIREADGADKTRLLESAMLIFGYIAKDWQKGDKNRRDGDFAWVGGVAEAKKIADEIIKAKNMRGLVCFLPAHPTHTPKIVADIVNPHYPDYYTWKKQKAKDNEDPKPNYFPAVDAGSRYGFSAVLMHRPDTSSCWTAADLLTQLRSWMEGAVQLKGAGAKTSAGYGWFRLNGVKIPEVPKLPSLIEGATGRMTALPAVVAQYQPGCLRTTGNFGVVLPKLNQIAEVAELRTAFELLVPENERKRLRRNNPYWQSFTSRPDGKAIFNRLGLQLT